MKKNHQLTATSLRIVLIISIFLIASLSVVGFSMVVDGLTNTAVDTSKTVGEANNSRNNVQNLQRIQTILSENKQTVERASSIVAESKSYQYQDQIISDLTGYATRAGISITNFDFSGATTPAITNTPTKPTTPKSTTPGVNSISVSVTVKNTVNYDNLLRFIYSIEQNLTKMQISRVGLSKESTGGVTSDALVIEVFV